MDTSPQPAQDPDQVIVQAHIIWGVLCVGLLIVAAVFIYMIQTGEGEGQAVFSLGPIVAVPWVMLVTAVPIGLFVRGQVFKAGWVGDVVTPGAYLSGSIMAWAPCEGTALASMIFGLMDHRVVPHFFAAGAAFAVLVLLRPNGKALRPMPERM